MSIFIPGPEFQVELAGIDSLHPVHYSDRLLIFQKAPLDALKAGLERLLIRCPILGGKVVPLNPGCRIEPGPGLELIVKDSPTSFKELEERNFTGLDLVPSPGDAACKVQYTSIDGGAIITWAMSHSVADGSGNNEMLRVLSEEIRGVHSDETMGLDRSLIRNLKGDFDIKDHPAYKLEIVDETFSAPEVPILFTISPEKLAQLKADASAMSTHDAMVALIWRSVVMIRNKRSTITTTNLFMPTDGRRHLGLPATYVGNAVYQLKASLEYPFSLKEASSAIRSAIRAITPEKVSSILAKTNEKWIEWGFMEHYATSDVAMGTDWTSGSLYTDDWGDDFGPLVRYRYPDSPGICILPKLLNGGAELVVSVLPEEVEVLKGDECFGKYI